MSSMSKREQRLLSENGAIIEVIITRKSFPSSMVRKSLVCLLEVFVKRESISQRLKPAIDACDRPLQEYWRKIGSADGLIWSANMAQHHSALSRLIKSVAQKQSFTTEV